MNLRLLKRRGRWNFVHELQPLAPLWLASMIRSDDTGWTKRASDLGL
jgi:arachidonate 15-lipoxygenase